MREYETTITVNDKEIDVFVDYDIEYGYEGEYSKEPENCYPSEPDKVYLLGLWGYNEYGNVVDLDGLLEYIDEGLEQEVIEFEYSSDE